uniref:Uncharacterized protein n=1 Tax=Oryza brachyantha TaxID=4533 RepID=J3MT67_ORYBR
MDCTNQIYLCPDKRFSNPFCVPVRLHMIIHVFGIYEPALFILPSQAGSRLAKFSSVKLEPLFVLFLKFQSILFLADDSAYKCGWTDYFFS